MPILSASSPPPVSHEPGHELGVEIMRAAASMQGPSGRRAVSEPLVRLAGCRTPKSLPCCVVDGHSLAFRAFYALPVDSFVTAEGQHTNAIHGFLSMLHPPAAEGAPDPPRGRVRHLPLLVPHREYPEYKGTRNETPPEFSGPDPAARRGARTR